MNAPKQERNKAIVEKREAGWSFRKLARFFHVTVSTVHEIYHRDREKYGRKKGARAFGVIPRRGLASVRR